MRVPLTSMYLAMGVCWKTAMSPGKKKLNKISWNIYEEQCHFGFFAEYLEVGWFAKERSGTTYQ